MTPLRLAWLSLVRRRFPTVVALLAIALPVAAGGVLLRLHWLTQDRLKTLDTSFDAVIGAKTGSLDLLLGALDGEGATPGINSAAYPAQLTANLYTSLRAKPSLLQQLIPLLLFGDFRGHRVLGTDDAYWQRTAGSRSPSPTFVAGRPPAATGEAAVSSVLAAAEGLHLGDDLHVLPWVGAEPKVNAQLPEFSLKLVGITAPTGLFWDRIVIAGLAGAQAVTSGLGPLGKLHPVWGSRVVHYMLADCPQGPTARDCSDLRDLIDTATIAQMVDVHRETQRLHALLGEGDQLSLIVTGMILLLGILATAGVMLMRFDGMLGQLAVLRAMGYSRSQLSLWLLWEGLLLGTAAAAIGAAVDAAAFPWLRQFSQYGHVLLQDVGPPQQALAAAAPVVVSLWHSAPVWGAAVAAAVLAACLPLLRLYRQDVHSSLRHQ